MQPLGIEEIIDRELYGRLREELRRRVIAYKERRRVRVGDLVTFVFEDRTTLWYQVQEMLWIESLTDPASVRRELETYNELIPGPGELSATMFIEIQDERQLREKLAAFVGVDQAVFLEVGDQARVQAVFAAGRMTADKIATVQYVRFPLSASALSAAVGGAPLAIAIDHRGYRARAVLPEAVRSSLATELAAPPSGIAIADGVR